MAKLFFSEMEDSGWVVKDSSTICCGSWEGDKDSIKRKEKRFTYVVQWFLLQWEGEAHSRGVLAAFLPGSKMSHFVS